MSTILIGFGFGGILGLIAGALLGVRHAAQQAAATVAYWRSEVEVARRVAAASDGSAKVVTFPAHRAGGEH